MSCWRTLYVFTSTDSGLQKPGTPITTLDEPDAGTFSTLQEYFDEAFPYYVTQLQALTPSITPLLNIEVPQSLGYPYHAVAERAAVLMRRLRALFPWWQPAAYGLHVCDPFAPLATPATPALVKNAGAQVSIESVIERVDIDCYVKWSGSGPLRYGYDPLQTLDDAWSWALYAHATVMDAYLRYGPIRAYISPIIVGAPTQKRVSLTTWNFMLASVRRWKAEGLLSEIVLFDGFDLIAIDEEVWSTVKNQTTTSLSGNSVKQYTDAAYTYATANP